MNESYPHLFSRRKGLDKRLKAYIRFRKGSFVKPETIRGTWQSGAVADSEHLLLVSATLCYHASICLPRRLRAGRSKYRRRPVYSGLSKLYGKQANFCAGAC